MNYLLSQAMANLYPKATKVGKSEETSAYESFEGYQANKFIICRDCAGKGYGYDYDRASTYIGSLRIEYNTGKLVAQGCRYCGGKGCIKVFPNWVGIVASRQVPRLSLEEMFLEGTDPETLIMAAKRGISYLFFALILLLAATNAVQKETYQLISFSTASNNCSLLNGFTR